MVDGELRRARSRSTARSTTSPRSGASWRVSGSASDPSSDTEVILKAYLRWGIDAVRRFRGIFALALWDPIARAVHLVRDPMGIKPLYWAIAHEPASGEEVVLFASEVRALLASGEVPRRLDPAAVASYLWHGFVIGPNTIVEGVHLLPAASILTISAGGAAAATRAPRAGIGRCRRRRPAGRRRPSCATSSSAPCGCSWSPTCPWASSSPGESTPARWRRWRRGSRPGPSIRSPSASTIPATTRRDTPIGWRKRSEAGTPRVVLTEQRFQEQLPDALAAIDQPTFDAINTYFVSRAARERGDDGGPGRHRRRRGVRRLSQLRRHSAAPAGRRARSVPAEAGRRGARLPRRCGPGGALRQRDVLEALQGRAAADALGKGRRRGPRLPRPPRPLPGVLRGVHARDAGRPGRRRGAGGAAAAGPRPAGRRSPRTGAGGSKAASPGTRSPCWSSRASSASACCATPTPPAWRWASRCACRCSTTSWARRRRGSIPRVASRRRGRRGSCATSRWRGSTPRSSIVPSPGSSCPSTRGRGTASARRWTTSSWTPGSPPRAGLRGEAVRTLWRSFTAGRPGLYWTRIWAVYVLMSWCAEHGVSMGASADAAQPIPRPLGAGPFAAEAASLALPQEL